MKSTLRRCWLGLASLLLTAGFGCGDGNDVNSQAQADQAVCLKVCLDAKGAFCETYCPPGDRGGAGHHEHPRQRGRRPAGLHLSVVLSGPRLRSGL